MEGLGLGLEYFQQKSGWFNLTDKNILPMSLFLFTLAHYAFLKGGNENVLSDLS